MRNKSILVVMMVATTLLVCGTGAQATLVGWTINEGDFFPDSVVISGGGTVTDEIDVQMNGGTIMQNLSLRDGARGEINGGDIRNFLVIDDISVASMYGGHVGSGISSPEDGSFNWYGGTIDGEIRSGWTSAPGGSYSYHTIYGYDFKLDGLEVTEFILTPAHSLSQLTGYLQDGTPIDNRIVIHGGSKIELVVIPEPSTPPVADADGPYTIYVGDTLTLDANGSTDADDDIVSYLWDLDGNGSFETDAGGQAIFDVNYAYLGTLGLLVDVTYDIHVKVTDSEGQSDTADSTLIIVPKPALAVAVDIKPGSCPNPLNVKSKGVLPVAILGTADVNVLDIDPASIAFSIGDVNVGSVRCNYEDVAAPVSDANDCNCVAGGPDGYTDLTLKFKTQEIVGAIGEVNHGDELTLELTGVLLGERPIEGADCIVIRGKHKPFNKADINKDGVVDMLDFATVGENWLQSSIVED